MEKPLFRWTMGPAEPVGFEILEYSVKKFKEINKEFDLLICHNNLEKHQLERIKKLDVPLFCQDGIKTNLLFPPTNVGNKLYPPRLRLNAHEVVMDNDIVLVNNDFLLDFLNKNYCFVTGHKIRHLGNFDKYVPENIKVNSGIFGLPPGFDFEEKIIHYQTISGQKEFEDYFDEQGIVAAIISNHENHKIISTDKILLCVNTETMEDKHPYGYHFVRANVGQVKHWVEYKKIRHKKAMKLFF